MSAYLTPVTNTIFNPGKRKILPFLPPGTFQAKIAAPARGGREPTPTIALPNQGPPLYNNQ
jgi:hypothetical protein